MRIANLALFCGAILWWPSALFAQITISGVTDKSTYNNSVNFTIGSQAGYDYNATLNWQPVAVGAPVAVTRPDFYELRVDATNQGTRAVTSQYLRFIVNASERVNTEWGLPPHVPFPVIQSCSNEFLPAQLRVLMPSTWPVGFALPVVTWLVDAQDQPVRANGLLLRNSGPSSGSPLVPFFQIKRGAGSGFIPVATSAEPTAIGLALHGLATNRVLQLQSNLAWTTVSGVLSGATVWTNHARIHVVGSITIPAGSTLTVGEGSVVLLNSRVDITNNGTVTINGTAENPAVFLPATNGQPWGGFVMRIPGQGIVDATATIFTGSGAEPNWFGANGNPGSHRDEQALFFCQGGQQLNLTNSAAIHLPGQLGHSVGPAITAFNATRFLMQRVPTGGEWTAAAFTVNDSAFIDCPDDTADFADGDNDALYIVNGTHFFTNTLFGWTKDDGIDSGASGYGPLTYQSCWFEAIVHEGNSLSGYKDVFSRGTVYFDCGQGIEDGYNAPTGRLDTCFFSMCQSGIRHGDNYPSIGNYDGRFLATNCVSIYNHRDLFGFNWHNPGGWTNSYDRFWVSNNFVSVLDTNYPNNFLWNPASDAWRLGEFGGVGRVGIGFGVRPGQGSSTRLPDGIPVGLSRFCTNEVRVDYHIQATNGASTRGTLVFPAGLTRRFIPIPTGLVGPLDVALLNPISADVTGPAIVVTNALPPPPPSPTIVLSPLGASWRFLDDGSEQGSIWRGPGFNDSTWNSGAGRLGFGSDASPVATTLRRYVQQSGTNTSRQVTNFYFRRGFVASNLTDFASVQFRYQRDDGCILYLNGRELFRNNMTAGNVSANTFSSTTISSAAETLRFWTNVFSITNLVEGTNLVAVEVHQASATSSDSVWDLEIAGLLPPATTLKIRRLGAEVVVTWPDASFSLQEAENVNGPWRPAPVTNSPAVLPLTAHRFYRVTK